MDIADQVKRRKLAAQTGKTRNPRVDEGQMSLTDRSGRTSDAVASAVQNGTGKTYERGREILEELEQEPDGALMMKNVENGDWDMQAVRDRLTSTTRTASLVTAARG